MKGGVERGRRVRLLAEFGRQVSARDACRGLPYFGMYRRFTNENYTIIYHLFYVKWLPLLKSWDFFYKLLIFKIQAQKFKNEMYVRM